MSVGVPAGVNVLLVDDEPKLGSLLSRAFGAQGLSVQVADNGDQGLALALTGRFQLVLLDLVMPGIDGVAVLERLMRERPDQRVLVLSALFDVGSKVRCLELGACDYVSKPFALAELIARLRTHLRRRRSSTIAS